MLEAFVGAVGGSVEARGMDEAYVDITAACVARLQARPVARGAAPYVGFVGHVFTADRDALVASNRHRPGDLSAVPSGRGAHHDAPPSPSGADAESALLLRAGSEIVAELRAAIRRETSFTVSAGIALSKVVSKLASGMHKPDQQTSIPASEARALLSRLNLQSLNGIGYRTARLLHELFDAAERVEDILKYSEVELAAGLAKELSPAAAARTAKIVHAVVRGIDLEPVTPLGPSKSISCEDSFRAHTCRSMADVTRVLGVLAPDLIDRLREEEEESSRVPQKLTLKWRYAGGASSSSSVSMPQEIGVRALVCAASSELQSKLAMATVAQHGLTKLSIAATGFVDRPAGAARPGDESTPSTTAGTVLSKKGARLVREGGFGRGGGIEHRVEDRDEDDGDRGHHDVFEDLRDLQQRKRPPQHAHRELSPSRPKKPKQQRGIGSFFTKRS